MVYRDEAGERALDAVFAALAHPVRRAVVSHLVAVGSPLPMRDLAAAVGVSPQLLTKHAAALQEAGLIRRESVGRHKHVHLQAAAMAPAQRWLDATTAHWAAQLDSLDRYVATLGTAAAPRRDG